MKVKTIKNQEKILKHQSYAIIECGEEKEAFLQSNSRSKSVFDPNVVKEVFVFAHADVNLPQIASKFKISLLLVYL